MYASRKSRASRVERSAIAVALLCVAMPPESHSQALEEIIVTATKRAQDIQDIPLSIAVIGNQDIERRGLIGMEDYLRSIPGVSQIDRGGVDNAVVIRGITTSPQSENFNSGTTVASYFDETPITGAAGMANGGVDVRPVDIERIEILRGPQGTAYGSASLSGAVRVIPMKPKLDQFTAKVAGSLSDTAGNGSENSMLQGIVNVPVGETLALRAVGYRFDEGGYYRNIAGENPAAIAQAQNAGLGNYVQGHVQDDVGAMVSTGGRLTALWQATDKLSFTTTYLTQSIEQDGAPEATLAGYVQSRLPIAPQARVHGERGEIAETDLDLLNLVMNYDLGWSALTATVSRVDGESAYSRDASHLLPFPASSYLHSDYSSTTAEARIASQLDGPLQFLAGMYYEDEDQGYAEFAHWPGAPVPSPMFVTNPMSTANRDRQLEQRALFGEISYELTDKLTATAGGRYFEYDKHERTFREGGLYGVPAGAGVNNFMSNDDSGSSLKANLTYEPTRESMVYASWSEGFRLGRPDSGAIPALCDVNGDGLIDGTGTTIDSTRTVDSDFLENYEIGAKFSLWNRRVVVDTAVYHIDWDGLPSRVTTLGGRCSFTGNVGSATSEGVELQASIFVSEGLRLDIGGGYTNAELAEDALSLPGSPRKGSPLPGAPKVNANLSAQYDFDVGGHKAFVRADTFYVGEFHGDLLESPLTEAGDYVKVDARAGITIKSFSIELFGRNLTNEDEFTWRGLANGNSFFGFRMRPRTVGIQLGYSFE